MSEFEVKNGIGIIPQGTSVIETDSFYRNEDLRHIEIPEGVIYINSSAFHSCANLESVYIPDSVTFIGAHPFLGCNSLKSLIIDEKNAVYDSRYNCNAIIESKTNRLIVGCSNTKIPHDVKELSSMSFRACKTLYNITIPKTVEIIGKHAFIGCHNLSVVEFEDHTRLEGWPFAGCKKLSHTKLDSFKEIRCSVMSVPENGRLMESSVYIAYDGSLYWVLNRNYYPVISSISPEMKYLTECLMIVKVGECWQLCVPERYNQSIEYYHDHQFSSCELVASNGSTLILCDGNKLYIWASDKRELSMYYDTIEEISKWNPSYIVSRDGRYGIVNSNLEVVVDCKYEKIQTMGRYLVYSTDSLFGLMSLKGDIILQPKYSSIEEFSTQSGPLKDYLKISSEGKWGYYGHNLHRSVLLDPEFDNINFKQGWFIVESNGRIGLIDNSCTRILSCVYDEINDFTYSQRHPSWEFLVKKDRKYGLIDGDEHVILPFQYDSIIRVFCDDYKFEYLEEYGTEDGDSIYKDESFMVHEVVYQIARDEETVLSWSRDGYGNAKLENPSWYIYICHCDGKWGILDMAGDTLIPFDYDEIEIDDLCSVKTTGSYRAEKYLRCFVKNHSGWGIRDTKDFIMPCCVDTIKSGGAYYIASKENKYGIISYEGKLLTDYVFTTIDQWKTGKYRIVYIDGKMGLLDSKGNWIIPCDYDNIIVDGNSPKKIVLVTNKNKYGAWCYNSYKMQWESYLPCDFDEISISDSCNTKFKGLKRYNKKIYSLPCMVMKNNKVGVYVLTSKGNKELIQIMYDEIYTMCSSNSHSGFVVVKSDLYGYINPTGEDCLECKYDRINCSNGYVWTYIGSKCGLALNIDNKIEIVLDCVYDEIKGKLFRLGNKYGKWGIVNRRPQIIAKPIYDNIEGYVVEINGKYGFIAIDEGTPILLLECNYDRIDVTNYFYEDCYIDDDGLYKDCTRDSGVPQSIIAEKEGCKEQWERVNGVWIQVTRTMRQMK